MAVDDLKKACETYVEQTKLLVALASAFLIAPAALSGLVRTDKGVVAVTPPQLKLLIWAEVLWVFSVVCGYVVLGTIAGSQHNATYDVYRAATRISSLLQLGGYLAGLILFVLLVVSIVTRNEPSPEARNPSQMFDERLSCRQLADSYVKEKALSRATVATDQVDYSLARNSCLASLSVSRGCRKSALVDYKVLDLLSGDVLFTGSCKPNAPKNADFCGNGRGVALRAERDRIFALTLKPQKTN